MNAEIEESEGEEAWGPDVEEELYVQLAGSKSEEEVDDKEMCRPALFPSGRGGRKGRKGGDGGGWRGMDGEGWCSLRHWRSHSGRSSLHPCKLTPPVSEVLQMTWVAGLSQAQRRGSGERLRAQLTSDNNCRTLQC